MTTNKIEKTIYRVMVSYTGKFAKGANKISTAFCTAISKEHAEEFVVKQVREALRQHNYTDATFDVKTSLSSQDEMDFYLQNRGNKNYSGVMN
jgi:hypothetical protein